jgi:hypothetical protein
MRSRREDVEPFAAVEQALTHGLCGMGEATDERARRRLDRFAQVPLDALVWTRDVDGLAYLGALGDGLRADDSLEARDVDLVHVRDCVWLPHPVAEADVPPAVRATFARGGRNFQQVHHPDVSLQSLRCWQNAPR